MTYTYTKFFDSRDSDGNSDPHSRTLPVTNTEGEKVNILMKKGLKVKVEVIDLDPYLSVQLSFNGLTTPVGRYRSIFYGKVVQQTVDNKTYWESQSYQTTEST